MSTVTTVAATQAATSSNTAAAPAVGTGEGLVTLANSTSQTIWPAAHFAPHAGNRLS